jgi:hypothetical protein
MEVGFEGGEEKGFVEVEENGASAIDLRRGWKVKEKRREAVPGDEGAGGEEFAGGIGLPPPRSLSPSLPPLPPPSLPPSFPSSRT